MTRKRTPWRTRWLMVVLAVLVYAGGVIGSLRVQQYGSLMLERKIAGCLPWTGYWYDKHSPPVIDRYRLVLFPARHMQPVIADDMPVGKMVVGLPGDTVSIKNGDVRINGVLIGDVAYGARKLGKPITYWDKTYQLGQDEIFVFGSERHSWDSRYWGAYPRHLVRGNLTPLF